MEYQNEYGATHFSVASDGVTPQMLYKLIPQLYNDGTTREMWHYLSYANIWMGSALKPENTKSLRPISEWHTLSLLLGK